MTKLKVTSRKFANVPKNSLRAHVLFDLSMYCLYEWILVNS